MLSRKLQINKKGDQTERNLYVKNKNIKNGRKVKRFKKQS